MNFIDFINHNPKFLFTKPISIRQLYRIQFFHSNNLLSTLYLFRFHIFYSSTPRKSFYSSRYSSSGSLAFHWFLAFNLLWDLGLNWAINYVNWVLLNVFIWKFLLDLANFGIALWKKFFVFTCKTRISIIKLLIFVNRTMMLLYWSC